MLDKARVILSGSGVPSDGLDLIMLFFTSPHCFDASKRRPRTPRVQKWVESNALNFARLFAQSPDAMIAAMAKINRLFHKTERSPQAMLLFAIGHEVELASIHHGVFRDAVKRFWTDKADAVAFEWGEELGLPITVKVVEHVRRQLRSISPKTK